MGPLNIWPTAKTSGPPGFSLAGHIRFFMFVDSAALENCKDHEDGASVDAQN